MAVKRGLQPPETMLKVLTVVNGASITETAEALETSTDRASELVHALQNYELVDVEKHPVGGRGRPRSVVTLTDRGRQIVELLQGESSGAEVRERDLRFLVHAALERCKHCSSTEPLGPVCLAVASYAHLLGMDWERGIPVCSCQRWPKQAKSWSELVED